MSFLSSVFTGQGFALLGAALAIALAGTGSAKGCGIAGEAAAGVISVAPENFGRCLILQALPGTQGIYGLLIAFLILTAGFDVNGITYSVVAGNISLAQGVGYFCASLPIAIGGYYSAIAQGRTAAAGIGIVAAKPEESMKGVIFAGIVETYAILSLLMSFLIYSQVPNIPL